MRAVAGNAVFVVGLLLCILGNWLFLRPPKRGQPAGRLRRLVLRDAATTRDTEILSSRLGWLVAPGFVLMVLGHWLAGF